MPETFGRHVRLRARAEFTAVQDGGRRVSSRFMTLVARPNALARDRLGVVASRRVGGAVLRNRAKRRLRELFRRRAEPDMSQAARSGYDIVAIARPELATAPFGQVRSDFDAALRRLRRLVR